MNPAPDFPAPDRARRPVGLVASAAALAACLMLMLTLPDSDSDWALTQSDPAATKLLPLDQTTMSVPLLSFSVDRYDTEFGTVEQRTQLTWDNVAAYDPEQGIEVTMSVPELEIELYLDEPTTVSMTSVSMAVEDEE